MLNFTKYATTFATTAILGSLLTSIAAFGQITTTTNRTALQLAQAITGNGVLVTNAVLNCAPTGNGVFVSPNNTVGINEGIVLSTGNANQVGNAESGVASTSFSRTGDADLTAISGTNVTRDACVLEFDVTPVGDELKFEYVFGSEEYINAVCGPFNDVFAFFISGPGITGTRNMALVPNTQIPVAVNSVNNGIVGTHPGSTISNCTGMGAGSPFTQYYINNTGNPFFAYRGYTTVFTAKQDVMPCHVYHLKLAIADAGNYLYDSGVFIKSGSLSSTSITGSVQAPIEVNNQETAVKGCTNAVIMLQRSQAKATPQNVQLVYAGTAQSGVDYAALPTTVTIPANATIGTLTVNGIPTLGRGDRMLTAYVVDPFNCNNVMEYVDTIQLQLIEMPSASLLTDDDTICSGIQVATSVAESRSLFSYNWTPNFNVSNPNIAEPILFPNGTTTYVMHATIPNSGCSPITDSITLTVISGPQDITFSEENIKVCVGGSIQVSSTVAPVIDGLIYSWTGPQGFTAQGKNLIINQASVNQSGWYKLSVTAEGCNTITDSILVSVVNSTKVPNFDDLDVCLYQQVNVANEEKYNWYLNPQGGLPFNRVPELNTNIVGNHTVYVSQSVEGCESGRVPMHISVINCCEKDMFIPNAFTPNNDGINDLLEVKFDPGTQLHTFHIFNRWGQKVYSNTGSDIRWDGTMNSLSVDNGVYYFYMEAQCLDGRKIERKGEIHVIR